MSVHVEHYGRPAETPREQVQRWLERVRTIDKRIESRMAEIWRLRDKQENLSRALDGNSTGGPRSDWTNVSDQLLDAVAEIEREIAELKRQRQQVREVIRILPEQWQLLLELRYFRGLDWWAVSGEMNYGRTTIWEMHREALDFLAQNEKIRTSLNIDLC